MKTEGDRSLQTDTLFPPSSSVRRVKVALFCGGRGSATIIHELLRWPTIDLTLIVNAYDDGLSTGALRRCVSQMLGPSDFRKNLSYLLDPYSTEQYALKHLLETRFPETVRDDDIAELKAFIQTEQAPTLTGPMAHLFRHLGPALSSRLRYFLQVFFNYLHDTGLSFDFRDCSMGNLIFTGAYVENQYNFNAAAKEMSHLVRSRALLVNVSQGENRILVGLKEDGELLATEAELVSPQSTHVIRNLFLVDKPINQQEWQTVTTQRIEDKEAWLRAREVLPQISAEAKHALLEADIIVYGPGTQHSSLFPSYRIAQSPIQQSRALIKAMIMNLEPDHDIQALSNSALMDQALVYMGDEHNHRQVITHVLVNDSSKMDLGQLFQAQRYKQCDIVRDSFSNQFNPQVHNGRAVVDKLLALWEQAVAVKNQSSDHISIFIDIHQRSLALAELYDELLEVDWAHYFTRVDLTVNQTPIDALKPAPMIQLKSGHYSGNFPEISYFLDWLHHEKSEYLMMLTGDGKYRFRDVMLAINLMKQSHFGAVFGSRNQSRVQFQSSLRAAYGEKKLLSWVSFLGSFFISAIFALRFSIVFSDPLTGFRLFRRSKIASLAERIGAGRINTAVGLATYLIKHQVEIAELPVSYRTFAGFVDPYWRMRRGFKNLLSIFSRHAS